MPLTLTEWWKKLDEETRHLAAKYGDISYPAALTTPYTNVDVDTDMTPWEAVHKMASLGAAIEGNVYSGQGIATKIDAAGKKLGEPLPNSSHYIPKITDERSLLLAVLYYRSQCRFQDIQSSSSLVQNGAFGKPGIEQNKPGVANEAEILRTKIKSYCSTNKDIAAAAQLKFAELFPHTNEVGHDLFKPKSFIEQHRDFASRLIGQLVENMDVDSHAELHKKTLDKTETIKRALKDTEKQLETLYIYKRLKEFIANDVKEYPDATFERFKVGLDPKYQENGKVKKIWDAAMQFANGKKSNLEIVTEGVNNYTPGFLQYIMHARLNPIAYFPWALGVDESSRLKKFKERVNKYVTSEIETSSQTLSQDTQINVDDLKTVSPEVILDTIKESHKLRLEIEALRTSVRSYVQEVSKNYIIKFSTAPFIGWFTKKLAEFQLTKGLLHDNIHYLYLAENFTQQLEAIKKMQDDENPGEALSELKKSMREGIASVRKSSHYLLFQRERDLAHKNFSNIVEEEDEGIEPDKQNQVNP